MLEFFCGWRRKIGAAMLLRACALMTLWVRSSEPETLELFNGRFESRHGNLQRWNYTGRLLHRQNVTTNGVEHVQIVEVVRYESFVFRLPYCFIVIPLTLLSAYLLLINPRPKSKQQVTHA